ncbi:MAG: glycosyl transferase [Bacteroidetes bacterium]|nr:MAG: glycosyl transferase [Bacteroidota bacterium]
MTSSSKISAVIATYNEEEHIRECVESLLPVVEEIIVVDSFSTDKTQEICLELGVKFLQRPWEGFSSTKNWANQQASYPFILSIDADEVISKELGTSLIKAKQELLDEHKVYKFNRLNNYCGMWMRYGGWYPDTKVRLFSNANAIWEGDVHERLIFDYPISEQLLEGDLLHYSIKDKADHIARVKKYCKLEKAFSNQFWALLSAINTFIRIYILKKSFLAGRLGYQLAFISALAKFWRGKT